MSDDPNIDLLANPVRLTPWLEQHVPELGDGPLELAMVSGGSSNVVMSVSRGAMHMILRRPPAVKPPNSEKTIAREATILKALNQTDVPHPYLHAYCAAPEVIGAPFYLMEKVDGWAAEIREHDTVYPPLFGRGHHHHYLDYALADGLIKLARVDYKAVGLGDFGRPEGFLQRQVDRWFKQLASYPGTYKNYVAREIPGLDYVAAWLRANTPDTFEPGIMHGDYASGNVLFAHNPPARLRAIIDWELATIGDPLMDLASMVQNLRDERGPNTVPRSSYYDSSDSPTFQEIAAYYAEGTGRDISNIDYYVILLRFKLACLLEYKVAEAAAGLAPKAKGERFAKMVITLAEEAKEAVARLG